MDNKNLHMKWWNFCKYFIFPIQIFIYIDVAVTFIFTIFTEISFFTLAISTISLGFLYFQIRTYIYFIKNSKKGYKLLIAKLILDFLISLLFLYFNENLDCYNFIQKIILAIIIPSAVFYINFIYFLKREYAFKGDKEGQIKIKQSDISLNLNDYSKEQQDKIKEYAEFIKNQQNK